PSCDSRISEEMYGLMSQLRRATVSIGANITEGWGRGSDGEISAFSRALAVPPAGRSTTFGLYGIGTPYTGRTSASLTGKAEVQRMWTALIQRTRNASSVLD